MTIDAFNQYLERRVPHDLSCSWDNDGLSCCPDPTRELRRVLVALDVTEEVVERALAGAYDLVLSHHPLLFRPLGALEPSRNVPRKLLRLACGGVAAIALHTRLDALEGGVNDALAEVLGWPVAGRFPCEGELTGRIVELYAPMTAQDFAALVARKLHTGWVNLADAGLPVRRVGLLGGEGGDFVSAARDAGCDTYLSGRIGYHAMLDARESGINVLEAGHGATERPVCARLAALVREADVGIAVDVDESRPLWTAM